MMRKNYPANLVQREIVTKSSFVTILVSRDLTILWHLIKCEDGIRYVTSSILFQNFHIAFEIVAVNYRYNAAILTKNLVVVFI